MLHVSFAMTSEAYADGSKTETRRFWKPSHAAKFTPGRLFMGIDKDFRAGGKRLHPARVVFCRPERLGAMSQDSFHREGGVRYWADRDDYIECMGGADGEPYVLRFEHLPRYSALYLRHSDTVSFYKDGDDLGFFRVNEGLLCVTTGEPWPPELRDVAAAYQSAHKTPEDDPCILYPTA